MNRVIFSVWVCIFAVALTACNKEDISTNSSMEEQNSLETLLNNVQS
jgi:hypothetical protein